MPRIGLTGGIGSGKSTVAALLQELGAAVVDADAVARGVADTGGLAVPALYAAFGADFVSLESGLNRSAMRALVFQDPAARQRLEAVLRPFILQGIADAMAAAERRAGVQAVVLDIPLLVENLAQWRPYIDHLLVVDCPPEVQIARVLDRPSSAGWTRAQVEGAIAAQATRAQRLAAADFVLGNGAQTSLPDLSAQVQKVWVQIRPQCSGA